jgi:hypothetical protein
VRFTGKTQQLNFAYMKLNVYAFENDVVLDGSSYTVFVNQSEENAIIDVFMPIMKEGAKIEAIHAE